MKLLQSLKGLFTKSVPEDYIPSCDLFKNCLGMAIFKEEDNLADMKDLQKQFPHAVFMIGDKEGFSLTESGLRSFAKMNPVMMLPYEIDKRDCNLFADATRVCFKLIGNVSIATAYGFVKYANGYHAFNIVKTNKGYMILEPQTGDIYGLDELQQLTFFNI